VPWIKGACGATFLYTVLALVMTWPLAAGLARDVPSDLGDPLLNCWILAWTANHAVALLSGNLAAAQGFWNANMLYPEPLTLAYSEHLVPQALQIAPLYAASGELILCYNLLFLSTYVLSGLGMFLFVREVTGAWRAALIAGLIYAFIPYRATQLAHLQVLSSQWMPFALFGLRRFFDTGRRLPLAGAAAATVAQNLSCTYYMAYFTPFLGAYVLYEIVWRGRVPDRRLWATLAVAAAVVVALTAPLVLPYMRLRAEGFVRAPPRAAYSADLASYVTAPALNRTWGSILRPFPQPGSDLFPGIVPLALAGAALVKLRRAPVPLFFCTGAALMAAWLSLGASVRLLGEPLSDAGLYAVLYHFVPGFDGLRVPARMGMVVMLFVAVLAGLGAYAITSHNRRRNLIVILVSALFVAESWAAPIPVNRAGRDGSSVLRPPARVRSGDDTPPVYRAVATLASDAVLLELPFGYRLHEAQYVFYSTVHWRKLVNGYSGWRPPAYRRTDRRLRSLPERRERAWGALVDSGATHVIVHEHSYAQGRGREISAWLIAQGAREMGMWEEDRLFELRPR
jgi:hypothetical protein